MRRRRPVIRGLSSATDGLNPRHGDRVRPAGGASGRHERDSEDNMKDHYPDRN